MIGELLVSVKPTIGVAGDEEADCAWSGWSHWEGG